MGRRRITVWRGRISALLLLAALAVAAWAWWQALGWTPPRAEYPMQGALVGERDGAVDFTALGATGADFVYLEASQGAQGRDARFAGNLAELEGGSLARGAVHIYDPCARAEKQAANFVTIVPRDPSLLPPVIALSKLASACGDPVIEAAVESELTTFINQVENHAGQPVVLMITPAFEAADPLAARIERNLWLERDWFEPDYAGRPWTLWTANSQLRNDATNEPLRWVVVQP